MATILLGIVAWLAGLLAYIGALGILYGQSISRGDLGAVVFGSIVAFGLCYWLLYLPVLRAVRRLRPQRQPVWIFPIVAILIGIVPTALIARFWGGSLNALWTPEALLFFILFGAVGLVVGFGFTFLHNGTTT